jgi:nucleoside-diphosphate-sugar epimerase
MSKRVLVTGAGGFVGRWSVPPLLAAGHEVHVLRSAPGAAPAPELAGATLHVADLFDAVAADALFAAVEATHLLHFAWVTTPGSYWNSPDNLRWLEAGRRMLPAFARNGGIRAVMAGSCAEYDWSRAAVCHEESTPLAVDSAMAYVACKLAMQRELAQAGRAHGLSTAWGRLFLQFGPYEHPDRLVPTVIRHLLAGREAECSHGRQVRAFLHSADVGAAFAALLDSGLEGAVNIGSQERVPVAEVIHRIAAHIGRPDLVRLGARPLQASEPPILVPDLGRLGGELGWRPRFDLSSALADTIGWWSARSGAANCRADAAGKDPGRAA